MAWFRLAGEGCFHAKVLAAKNDAYGAWCRAGQWSSEHLTEGRITRDVALAIAPVSVWNRLRDAKAGSEHGLVEEIDGGWQIHDYLDWNPTAEQALAKRAARAEAGRKGGEAKAARKQRDGSPPASSQAKDLAIASPAAKQKPTPSPSPSPLPDQIPENLPVSVSQEPRAPASQEPSQSTHTQSTESYEMPTLPDAEWLAAELAKRPALARFADDMDLCADLAGGLQDRSRTRAQASQIVAAFAAKEGKAARDMSAAEFQRLFGGYIVNARLHAAGPSSEPQFPEVREALTIFAERWKASNGATRVEETDDAEHAAACIEMVKKAIVAAKSGARPREVYRRAVDAYLADSAPWLADAQWPLRTLARKFSSYASLPTPKPRPGPAKAPEEPTMPTRRRATYAEAAAMAQRSEVKSGNMGPSLALVFDRDKVASG